MHLVSRSLLGALVLSTAGLLSAAHAQVFEAGDIVIPGNRVVDSFGNVHGCFYRLRGGAVTRWFESPSYRYPGDMIVDGQGRLVFWASPASRNSNDAALFRVDPATGSLERLFYFPYIVAPGDTLPEGAGSATGFYGTYNQSLHREKALSIEINDAENGGWPQIVNDECYGFSIGTSAAGGPLPSAYRYRPRTGTCQLGIPVGLLPWSGPVFMADDGSNVYYGLNNVIGRTRPAAHLSLHLDGDWGSLDASLAVNPKNEIVVNGQVYDNTFFPNTSVTCGPQQDDDVPWNGNGFSVLSMSGLGVLGGSLYALSSSGATGVPYVFDLAMRGPYLNPYVCQWYTACSGYGPLGFWLEDGTATGSSTTSPDGGALLGNGNGRIKRITPSGGYSELATASGDAQFTGRPWRWPGGSAAVATAQRDPGSVSAAAAAADSGAQVLVVRADALVHVLLTDGLGRRVGFDAAGGTVNDFGDQAQTLALGPGGWPRIVALRDPDPGTWTVEVAATAAGDWTVEAYLAHESGDGLLHATSGSAAGPGSELRGLYVARPLGLTWYSSPTGVGGRDDPRVGFVSVAPVPARGPVRFAYQVPASGAHVRLEIFDVLGRRVATALEARRGGGAHTLSWDGLDDAGRRLARGLYLANLDVDGVRDTRRVVLVD